MVLSAEYMHAELRTCHDHLRDGAAVPGQLRNLARVLVGAHRRRKLAAMVFASNAAKDGEWNCDEEPDDENDDDGAHRQGRRRLQDPLPGLRAQSLWIWRKITGIGDG